MLLDGEVRFALRAADYAAAPFLSGTLTSTRLRMAARAGRFPGTATRSDVTLDARFDGARWRARLRVPGLGVVATGDLVAWLQGGVLTGRTASAFVDFAGKAALSLMTGRRFTIDCELRLCAVGRGLAMFRHGEKLFAADALSLRAGRPEAGQPGSRMHPRTEARLAVSGAPSKPLGAVAQLPAGLAFDQRGTGVERLVATADERSGAPHLELTLDGRGGALKAIVSPQQGAGGAALAIGRLQHVSFITSDREESHLIADLAPAGGVLDALGIRLGLGSGEGEGGLEVSNRSGQLDHFLCSAPVNAFELPLGDSVVPHVTVPPNSRIGLWFDWPGTPPASHWCTLHLNPEGEAALQFPHFSTSILRPQDLLLLGFDFSGVEIRHRHGRPLIYKQAGSDAYLRVTFPPQHVAEPDVYWDTAGGDPSVPSPINHAHPTPGSPTPLHRALGSALTPPSRLVFRLPESTEQNGLRFDVDTLLDWSAFQMAVSSRAPPASGAVRPLLPADWRDPPAPAQAMDPPGPRETALHLPTKLILSPHAWSTWFHSRSPRATIVGLKGERTEERTELWHTRLAPFQADSVDPKTGAIRARHEVTDRKDPRYRRDLHTVRAISTSLNDAKPHTDFTQPTNWSVNEALPEDDEAKAIARLSSDFTMQIRKCDLSVDRYDPVPIDYAQLHLSALGATMGLHAHWPTGVFSGSDIFDEYVEYTHRTVNGRDDYVAIAALGFTLWSGHEVLFITARPREDVLDETGGQTAVPRRRYWCEVTTPTIDYEVPVEGHRGLGRRSCFKRVTIEPSRTIMLQEPIDLLTKQPAKHPTAFWMIPEGAAKDEPFRFKFTAFDCHGKKVVFSMPLLWVSGAIAARVYNVDQTSRRETLNAKLQTIVRDYYDQDSLYKPWRAATLNNQKVNAIPDVGDNSRDRSLEVETIDFNVELLEQDGVNWPSACDWPVQFYPAAAGITARTGTTSRLGSETPAQLYRYNGWYAAYGLAPAVAVGEHGAGASANPGGIYLDVLPHEGPPGMQFPPEKAGGVAQPSLAIRHIGLSGPIGGDQPTDTTDIRYVPLSAVGQGPAPLVKSARGAGVTAKSFIDSDSIKGKLNPLDMFGNMKLFGTIPFSEICREIEGFQEIADSIPRLEEQYRKAVAPILENIEKAKAEFDRIRQLPQQIQNALSDFLRKLSDAAGNVQHAVEAALLDALLSAQAEVYAAIDALLVKVDDKIAEAIHTIDSAYDSTNAAEYEDRLRRAAKDAENLRTNLQFGKVVEGLRKDLQGAVDSGAAFVRSGLPFGRYLELPKLFESAVRRFGDVFSDPARAGDALSNLQRSIQDMQALLEDAHPDVQETKTLAKLAVNSNGAFKALDERIVAGGKLEKDLEQQVADAKAAWLANAKPILSDADRVFMQSRDAAWQAAERAIREFRNALLAKAQTELSAITTDATNKIRQIQNQITQIIDSAAALVGDAQKKLGDIIDPLLAEVEALVDALPQTIDLNYSFEPALHDNSIFLAKLGDTPASLKMAIRITQDLRMAEKGPDYAFFCQLTNSTLVIPPSTPFLQIGLKRVSFTSRNGQRPDVSLTIGKIDFGGQLKFLAELQKLLNPSSGPYLEVDPSMIAAGFRLPVPAITTGAFSLTDLSINPEIRLFLDGSPMRGRLAVSSRAKPAIMAFGVYGGTLFVALETGPDKAVFVEGAIDGGLVSVLNFAGATGCATVTMGIYFKLSAQSAQLTGYFRAHGSFDVYGLITLNIDFYLGLTYQSDGSAWGVCRISVRIGHGIFSFTVTVTAERRLAGSSGGGGSRNLFTEQQPAYDGIFRLGSESEAAWLRQQQRFGSWSQEPAYG